MKRMVTIFIAMSIVTATGAAVFSQESEEPLVWTVKGCDASYIVGESITVYYTPRAGEEFELRSYDAVMNEKLLSEGVGDGNTYEISVIAELPPGPLTFFLRMPCERDCDLCDLCDYGHCTVMVEKQDQCKDHCSNGVQDCREYGIDCGGGCPVVDTDRDGIEDCVDDCPDSKCDKVDSTGCETDSDGDGISDCDDECPDKKGDLSHEGCPADSGMSTIILIIAVLVGGLILLKIKRSTR